MRSRVYIAASLVGHGAVIRRTLGGPVTDTHESTFIAERPDDSLTLPFSRPIADKLIGGIARSFDPAIGSYVNETAGEVD